MHAQSLILALATVSLLALVPSAAMAEHAATFGVVPSAVAQPGGGYAIDPSWIPLILANDPASFPVILDNGAPSLRMEGVETCPEEVGVPLVARCENGVLIVSLRGPLRAQQVEYLTSLGVLEEAPPGLIPTDFGTQQGFRRECTYHDTNHYSCCEYWDSGMEYCYDYYYECHKSGRYNWYCGWSKHEYHHKCQAYEPEA